MSDDGGESSSAIVLVRMPRGRVVLVSDAVSEARFEVVRRRRAEVRWVSGAWGRGRSVLVGWVLLVTAEDLEELLGSRGCGRMLLIREVE